jgi:hypothetical protein
MLGLVVGLAPAASAAAQDRGCAPPPSWSEASGRYGQPEAGVTACLRAQAWETRDLNVPVKHHVAGIVAQCEVRVVFFEGPQGSVARFRAQQRIDANDHQALLRALADVTWARGCAGR